LIGIVRKNQARLAPWPGCFMQQSGCGFPRAIMET